MLVILDKYSPIEFDKQCLRCFKGTVYGQLIVLYMSGSCGRGLKAVQTILKG